MTAKEVIGRIALWSCVATTGALAGCGSLAAGSHQGLGPEQPSISQSPAPVATKPPAGYVPTFAPCAPIVLPTMGINNSPVQVGPGSWDDFVTANQWTGPVGSSRSESYVVWAGATGDAAVLAGCSGCGGGYPDRRLTCCSTKDHRRRGLHRWTGEGSLENNLGPRRIGYI